MKAIAVVPGTHEVQLIDRSEPKVSAPDEVKIRIMRVGICGTDREEANGGRAEAPAGRKELVLGHEMLGRVVEAGSAVRRVKKGDLAVFTVRRGCGHCMPCAMNRSDMCRTGDYRERGIQGLDGYQTEYVVDHEQYLVRIPEEIEAIGVLTEPLSVVEKAIDEAIRLQFARLPAAASTPDWLHGRPCLVAGLGPIGLLAALVLVLRGAEVHGLDVVDASEPRPRWLEGIGGRYIDGKSVSMSDLRKKTGPMELVFAAMGAPAAALNLLEVLGRNGVYVLTGIPSGDDWSRVPAAELVRKLVLDNQAMVGSVNAARGHFQMAVDDLLQAHCRWPGHVDHLITNRLRPEQAEKGLHAHDKEEIKTVVEWWDGDFARGNGAGLPHG